MLFERIIEPLCDGFTQRGAETYRRLFAQVVDVARLKPHCAPLAEALAAAGLHSERELLRCAAPRSLTAAERERIRAVVMLSRLTLGADVAVSMPLLRYAEAAFPNAEIAFCGAEAAEVIARSCSRVSAVKVPYGRSGFLAERLNAWPALLEAVAAVRDGHAPHEVLVIDPDSRLTQLGLLRPISADRYFHFPSRHYGIQATDPLAALACRWMHETFEPATTPEECRLDIARHAAAWVGRMRRRCFAERPGPIISVHFGVGGNEKKRAGIEFETELLEWLVRGGHGLLLARGASREEIDESYRLCRRLADRGVRVAHLPAGYADGEVAHCQADMWTWEADIDALLATIAHSDGFVGYDSAGQHISASLGVPTVSLFVEASGRRHAQRWTPRGRGPLQVVRSPWPPDRRVLLERAQVACADLARDIATAARRNTALVRN